MGFFKEVGHLRREKQKAGKGWLGRFAHGYTDRKIEDMEKAARILAIFDPVKGKALEEAAAKTKQSKAALVGGGVRRKRAASRRKTRR